MLCFKHGAEIQSQDGVFLLRTDVGDSRDAPCPRQLEHMRQDMGVYAKYAYVYLFEPSSLTYQFF